MDQIINEEIKKVLLLWASISVSGVMKPSNPLSSEEVELGGKSDLYGSERRKKNHNNKNRGIY